MSPRGRRPPGPDDVLRLGAGTADSRAFRSAVLYRLRESLGFDWYAWVLTDPGTTVGTDPVAEVPDLGELPTVIRLKYLTPVNRWTRLDVAALLGGAEADSPLWQQVQRRHGVVDVASVVLRDQFGCWGFLDLWSSRPYTATDLSVLRHLAPSLTTATRLHQARTFEAVAEADVPTDGPVVLLLDDELRVTAQTPATGHWLRILLAAEDGSPPVPAVALNVAAQLLARESGVDDHVPLARVRMSGAYWLTVRASRIEPGHAIAVTVEAAGPDDRLDVFARAHGLTDRERDVVAQLAQGTDTREVAAHLFLSPHTVQDHLKSIFAKTGTHTRRVLLSHVLGVRPTAG